MTRIDDLYPHLSEEDREKAAEALDEYLRLVVEIHQSSVADSSTRPYDEGGRPITRPNTQDDV